MLRFSLILSILLFSAIGFLTSMTVHADETSTTVVTPVTTTEGVGQKTTTTTVKDSGVVEQKETIVTQSPAPQEIVTPPAGYTSCETVAAGWYNNVWVPTHQVCKYTAAAEGVAWVEGYWACDQYRGSECTNWVWKSGHWVKTLENF